MTDTPQDNLDSIGNGNGNGERLQLVRLRSRMKSPLFWIGMVSAVFTAVINVGVTAGVEMPWWVGAIGVGLSTIMIYANGNNPSICNKK
ncbi:MAG: hypothetical protein GX802_08365 [Clostridiales bacterium]|nr:hypothetical protein [Clostridiales bacterium]